MTDGRFAPSPTGDLHLGNLRTAMLAWLFARSGGGRFVVRMEDLDRVTSSPDHEARQLDDLASLGLDWDGAVVRQSERFAHYEAAIARLEAAGLTYPCFCTRREIRLQIEAAAAAPHPGGLPGYPGTCRDLDTRGRSDRAASGRPAALRLRAGGGTEGFADELSGHLEGPVDDIVLRRNDGVPAYHVAVVVDDDLQGVHQVVRGDDLIPATPAQVRLARLLGVEPPRYAHVPLVLGVDGERLAKRHGAVTLADLAAGGTDADAVRGLLAASVGLARPGEAVRMDELLDRFEPARLPRAPWTYRGHPGES